MFGANEMRGQMWGDGTNQDPLQEREKKLEGTREREGGKAIVGREGRGGGGGTNVAINYHRVRVNLCPLLESISFYVVEYVGGVCRAMSVTTMF